ncbi:MAG TPA: helix-turn-helix domain-containing protein [Terriglobia bacterium]
MLLRRGAAGRNHWGKGPAVSPVPLRPKVVAELDLPPSPRQKRSREKRARLLAAGLALFGEKGYQATSVGKVAARAGVAVGGFYLHFRNKRQLLLVLMDELLEGLSRLDLRPQGAVSVRAGLRALLQSAFTRELTYTGAYRAWQEAVLLDGSLAPLQRQIERWSRARVTAVFELLLQLPGARAGVNVPALARLMDRLFWDLLGQALRMRPDELDAALESTTDLIYHALFTDSTPAPARHSQKPA